MIDVKEKHIPDMFFKQVEERGDQDFLAYKDGDQWKKLSFGEVNKRVRNFALGLISLGITKTEHVAIFSPNRPEWAISDLAILSAAAADIPIYPTNSSQEAEYILNDSASVAVIAAEKEHFDRIMKIRDKVPTLRHIIILDDIEGADDPQVHRFDDVMEMGANFENKEELERRIDATHIDDMATLIYTSGTTGPPKGVMLTHSNFLHNLYQAHLSHEEIFVEGQISLSFLPLSHSLERMAGWYLPLHLGGTIYYAQSPLTVMDDMREVRPNYVISVPRIFEKIYAGLNEKLQSASPFKKKLFGWAQSTGAAAIAYTTQNKPMPFMLSLKHKLARKLVLDKIPPVLGMERIKVFVSGGGPLAREINEFFHSLGITIHEGYGLTETTPVLTVITFDNLRFGTVGKPVLDTEIKIADDGEILARGPQIMRGYYNNPEATAEAITPDGWFLTGDIGEINDGYLSITDRKKELIITAGGKNISPANIENAMVIDRFIENIVSIGDGLPFITALIVPDYLVLEPWAQEQGIEFSDQADLISKPEVRKLFEERLAIYNEQFARVEQVKKFVLLPAPFSQETGELTPTMKLKRKVVAQKYDEQIKSMYKR